MGIVTHAEARTVLQKYNYPLDNSVKGVYYARIHQRGREVTVQAIPTGSREE